MTLAFGDYDKTEDESETGIPLTYWIPTSDPQWLDGPSTSPEAIAWLEEYLGPYPFDTGGILVVDSESGMETQTMITLGDTEYSTSPATVVHEFAHQWYGDQVTPDDWRDVWMNEGWAMYLQLMWESEQAGVEDRRDDRPVLLLRGGGARHRRPAGRLQPRHVRLLQHLPRPGVHVARAAAEDRRRRAVLGDRARLAASQDNTSTDRETLYAYWEQETGLELSAFFDDWILGTTTPPRS